MFTSNLLSGRNKGEFFHLLNNRDADRQTNDRPTDRPTDNLAPSRYTRERERERKKEGSSSSSSFNWEWEKVNKSRLEVGEKTAVRSTPRYDKEARTKHSGKKRDNRRMLLFLHPCKNTNVLSNFISVSVIFGGGVGAVEFKTALIFRPHLAGWLAAHLTFSISLAFRPLSLLQLWQQQPQQPQPQQPGSRQLNFVALNSGGFFHRNELETDF